MLHNLKEASRGSSEQKKPHRRRAKQIKKTTPNRLAGQPPTRKKGGAQILKGCAREKGLFEGNSKIIGKIQRRIDATPKKASKRRDRGARISEKDYHSRRAESTCRIKQEAGKGEPKEKTEKREGRPPM